MIPILHVCKQKTLNLWGPGEGGPAVQNLRPPSSRLPAVHCVWQLTNLPLETNEWQLRELSTEIVRLQSQTSSLLQSNQCCRIELSTHLKTVSQIPFSL